MISLLLEQAMASSFEASERAFTSPVCTEGLRARSSAWTAAAISSGFLSGDTPFSAVTNVRESFPAKG